MSEVVVGVVVVALALAIFLRFDDETGDGLDMMRWDVMWDV
jgi:hypothetical protein